MNLFFLYSTLDTKVVTIVLQRTMPQKKASFQIFSSNSSDAPWSRTFFNTMYLITRKKITQWEINSDLIKSAGEAGKKPHSLSNSKTILRGFRSRILTGFSPAVISFMTHPKSMSRQQLELGLCLFLQSIRCKKWEQILVLRFSSASS